MTQESFLHDVDLELLNSPAALPLVTSLLPFPDEEANKYTRGTLVLIAGSARYPGAAVLAARASQTMGSGYTHVITAPEAVDIVRLSSASLVVSSWGTGHGAGTRQGTEHGAGLLQNTDHEVDLLQNTEHHPKAVCIGSGFDPADPAHLDLVANVLDTASAPVVIDGGALALLQQPRAVRIMEKRAQAGWHTTITPHQGEAMRIAATVNVDPHEGDNTDFALNLASAFDCTVLLKGPNSYIADDGLALEMAFGGPELAKAGTGDVLAGMVGSLQAQQMHPYDACVLGATIHAIAGMHAAQTLTSICVTAEDVLACIPPAIINMIQSAKDDEL